MKKLLIFAVCLVAFAACKNGGKGSGDAAQADSLQRVIDQKDGEINDMMGTLNDIQEGFRQINEAEGKLELMQSGEGTNKAQQIRESVQFIAERMEQNRQLIEKLRQQLRESSVKGDELKKTIENLMRQIEDKDKELQKLRAELDAKDIHISELDEAINNLKNAILTYNILLVQQQIPYAQGKQAQELLERLQELYQTRKELALVIGERVVNPRLKN